MIINLNPVHKEHLSVLFDLQPQVIQDFCKLTTTYLTDGPNKKQYTSIARKLSLESASNVQDSVEALVYFLLLATILNINEYDFCNTLYSMGFREDQESEKILYAFYMREKYNLYRTLIQEYIGLMHFKCLDWRFEGTLATRSHLHQAEPKFTVRLRLENNSDELENKCIDIEIDAKCVLSISQCLEQALSNAKLTQRKISQRKQQQKKITSVMEPVE